MATNRKAADVSASPMTSRNETRPSWPGTACIWRECSRSLAGYRTPATTVRHGKPASVSAPRARFPCRDEPPQRTSRLACRAPRDARRLEQRPDAAVAGATCPSRMAGAGRIIRRSVRRDVRERRRLASHCSANASCGVTSLEFMNSASDDLLRRTCDSHYTGRMPERGVGR